MSVEIQEYVQQANKFFSEVDFWLAKTNAANHQISLFLNQEEARATAEYELWLDKVNAINDLIINQEEDDIISLEKRAM